MSQSTKNVPLTQNKVVATSSEVVENEIKTNKLVLPPLRPVNREENSNSTLNNSIEVSRVNLVETEVPLKSAMFTIDTSNNEPATLLVGWKSKHTNSFKKLDLNQMGNFPYSSDIGSVNKVTNGDTSTYLVKMAEGFSGNIEVLIGQSDVYIVSATPNGFNIDKKII